jgi:glycosyltransferase involved in cell wall biosynthesis
VLKSHFVLVCFGGPAFTAEEYSQLAHLGLADSVLHRCGSDRELAGYYAGAVALVCPSLCEGFGMPVVEAMGLGCPVLCANAGSLPEVAGDAARYFDPQQVDALRQAMEDLLDQPGETQARVEQGRRRAKLFTWDACATGTAAVYAELSPGSIRSPLAKM